MPEVKAICRYPIKGLSPESLTQVQVEADGAFPLDRVYALARPGAPIDPAAPRWAKKGLFVMSMLDDGLSEVATRLDPASMRLQVTRDGALLLEADLRTGEGRDAIESFFEGHVPGLGGRPRLVRAQGGHFMDKPDNLISLINLATLRSLEAEWGCAIDPLRFRANLYIDGLAPWAEFEWIGAQIRIGGTLFQGDRRNGRCGATNVNPANGKRDLDIPGALRRAYGHKDLGVYLRAREAGEIRVGDAVFAPEARSAPPAPPPVAAALPRFLCRGCYYIHSGPSPEALPRDWACPDCGTDRGNLRPYRARMGG